MAKAETKGAAKEQQNVSADNVVEKLMKGNLVTDIADKAAEEIRQDEEKRKISQVKEIVKCADFLRIKELLNVRKDRAKAKITLDDSEEAYRIVGPSSGQGRKWYRRS